MKLIITNFFCLWALLLPSFLQAQTAYKRAIGVTTGVSLVALKNEAYSPLIYKGIQVPIAVFYQRNKEKKRQTWLIRYAKTTYFSYFDNTTKSTEGVIEYAQLRPFGKKLGLNWWLGGVWANQIGYRTNQINLDNLNDASGELISTLQLAAMAELPAKRSILRGGIRYGLLGYTFGNTYNSFVSIGGRGLHPLNIVQLEGLLQYERYVDAHWSTQCTYHLYWFAKPEPLYLGFVKHRFDVSLIGHF